MLSELQNLQTLIKELNAKYQKNLSELNQLKGKPMVDATVFSDLENKQKLLKNNFTDLQSKFDDLAHEMAKLQKKHQEKCAECDDLNGQLAHLISEKRELIAKNEISSQRAQTILERLSALDADGSKPSTAR